MISHKKQPVNMNNLSTGCFFVLYFLFILPMITVYLTVQEIQLVSPVEEDI